MAIRIEEKIISNLIFNEEYLRKVYPYIELEYFSDKQEKTLIEEILVFFKKYNKSPTKDIIEIEVSNRTDISDIELEQYSNYIQNLTNTDINYEWLVENTEKFCKEKAVYNALLKSIGIINETDKVYTKDSIPKILQDALNVSFDQSVGHSYLEDGDRRYEFYHTRENKLPFDIDLLNKITNGGLSDKSLSIILAGSGRGKSAFLCHVAAATLIQNKSVVYITLEMAEERIAERIDANLMNISLDDLKDVDKATFDAKLKNINKKTQGQLIIKEYPTTSAHAGHFRALLEELKNKKDFKPDLIIVDYLNICASSRLKANSYSNSFSLYKSVAEELRGLGMEYNVPVLSASQITRASQKSSDVELTDIAESIGVVYVADLVLVLIGSEELDQLSQIAIKQLKNRYRSINKDPRFIVGVDMDKMRFYDVEEIAQSNLTTESYVSLNSPMENIINSIIDDEQYKDMIFN